MSSQKRRQALSRSGADESAINEVMPYCASPFESSIPTGSWQFPLDDEPFVPVWQEYLAMSLQQDTVSILQQPFVQWNFPVLEGLSSEKSYVDVVRRFASVSECKLATGHGFQVPDGVRLQLYSSAAGHIPIVYFATRLDFEYAWQALTKRNEPVAVPPAIGAAIIAGFNNVDRINRYKQQFLVKSDATPWPDELRALLARKADYQDGFILISPGAYSNVEASELGLSKQAWQDLSIEIRVHHEVAHYFMRRVCGSMNSHLLDEIIADYMGLVCTLGYYRADWFITFMGFDDKRIYTKGGRMEHYTQSIVPGSGSFVLLQKLLVNTASNLEKADTRLRKETSNFDPVRIMVALTTLSLDELAMSDGADTVCSRYRAMTVTGTTPMRT